MMIQKIFTTAIACMMAFSCYAQHQTDEFTTKSGKKVRFTCIKHASIQINYNGLEIEVDPVGMGMKPETDYSKFPKANIILVTHEHHDHFDRDAIAQLSKASTKIFLNPAVQKMKAGFRIILIIYSGLITEYQPRITSTLCVCPSPATGTMQPSTACPSTVRLLTPLLT